MRINNFLIINTFMFLLISCDRAAVESPPIKFERNANTMASLEDNEKKWLDLGKASERGIYRDCAILTELYFNESMETIDGFNPKHRDILKYCEEYTFSIKQGNALDKVEDVVFKNWKPSLGSALKVLLVDSTTGHIPYVQRTYFKSLKNCNLAMRVYKVDKDATNLKPLLLFHGGGWGIRGGSLLSLDAYASTFANRGYVVFAPFYRYNNGSGPIGCQHADIQDINSDIVDAMEWVFLNHQTYGADVSSGKLSVAGGSLGAQMAGYLGVHHADKIDKVLMVSPMTDFDFFQKNSLEYQDTCEQGSTFVRNSFGLTVEEFSNVDMLSENTKLKLKKNSLPAVIKEKLSLATYLPTFYLIHGARDSVAPIAMSTRMCDALTNLELSEEALPTPAWEKNRCGLNGSMAFYSELGQDSIDVDCLDEEKLANMHEKFSELGLEITDKEVIDLLSSGNLGGYNDEACKAGNQEDVIKLRRFIDSVITEF